MVRVFRSADCPFMKAANHVGSDGVVPPDKTANRASCHLRIAIPLIVSEAAGVETDKRLRIISSETSLTRPVREVRNEINPKDKVFDTIRADAARKWIFAIVGAP